MTAGNIQVANAATYTPGVARVPSSPARPVTIAVVRTLLLSAQYARNFIPRANRTLITRTSGIVVPINGRRKFPGTRRALYLFVVLIGLNEAHLTHIPEIAKITYHHRSIVTRDKHVIKYRFGSVVSLHVSDEPLLFAFLAANSARHVLSTDVR